MREDEYARVMEDEAEEGRRKSIRVIWGKEEGGQAVLGRLAEREE